MQEGDCFIFVYEWCVWCLKCLVALVPNIVLCEDCEDRIGCCEIILVFILDFVLTNIYALYCHSIPEVLPY